MFSGVCGAGPIPGIEARRGAVRGLAEGDDWGQQEAGQRLLHLSQRVVRPVPLSQQTTGRCTPACVCEDCCQAGWHPVDDFKLY